jgi:hypothetical protein
MLIVLTIDKLGKKLDWKDRLCGGRSGFSQYGSSSLLLAGCRLERYYQKRTTPECSLMLSTQGRRFSSFLKYVLKSRRSEEIECSNHIDHRPSSHFTFVRIIDIIGNDALLEDF